MQRFSCEQFYGKILELGVFETGLLATLNKSCVFILESKTKECKNTILKQSNHILSFSITMRPEKEQTNLHRFTYHSLLQQHISNASCLTLECHENNYTKHSR